MDEPPRSEGRYLASSIPGRIAMGLEAVVPGPSVVSIGFFDGVHIGHQAIIRHAVGNAHAEGLRSAVVTFDRHPMEVTSPGSQPHLLMTLARRAETIARLGVDLVVVLAFDDALRHWSPEEFVDHVLAGPLEARRVVVGSNFRFGHKATGDVVTLADLGDSQGFVTESVTLSELGGVPISSTEVRRAVEAGDVDRAWRLLGRPHAVDGVVVRGDQRGAGLGFPTANLQVQPRIAVPARGIYAGHFRSRDDDVARRCVTSVGVNPTFGGQDLRIEAYVLDFSGDLYGRAASVDFRARLRGEQHFPDVEPLVAQMHVDVRDALRALDKLPD